MMNRIIPNPVVWTWPPVIVLCDYKASYNEPNIAGRPELMAFNQAYQNCYDVHNKISVQPAMFGSLYEALYLVT